MEIQLYNPDDKQLQIHKAINNKAIFYVICVIGRQFGKSCLAWNQALAWAINENDKTIYWVSPTYGQAQKVYHNMVNAVFESGCIKSKKQGKGDMEILFDSGSKILFRSAEAEDSLRGESVHYMILDEAAFIKKSTLDAILLPMLTVTGKKLLVITTPKGKNWVHDWFLLGQSGDVRYKSFRFSSYESPRANPQLLNERKLTMPEKIFEQEYLAEFVDSASVFNNISDVMTLPKQLQPTEGDHYFAGIDIGIINDASVLAIMNNHGQLVNYYRWEKTEAPELIEEFIRLNSIWKFKKIMIENNNQGLTIYHDLRRRLNNVEEFNTNSKSKGEIINGLIHAFNMRTIQLCHDELLRIELEAYIFKQKDGRIKFEADSGFHDDIVMSLAIVQECYEIYKGIKFDAKRIGIFTVKPIYRSTRFDD